MSNTYTAGVAIAALIFSRRSDCRNLRFCRSKLSFQKPAKNALASSRKLKYTRRITQTLSVRQGSTLGHESKPRMGTSGNNREYTYKCSAFNFQCFCYLRPSLRARRHVILLLFNVTSNAKSENKSVLLNGLS